MSQISRNHGDATETAVTVARWAAMALATYAVMGVVYSVLVLASAGGPLLSVSRWEVMTAFLLPAFYANPARALVVPGITAVAFVVSAVAVVLVARAIESL